MPSEVRTPEERKWAVLAHLSMLATLSIYTLVLGTSAYLGAMFIGPLVAYLIYILNRRSRGWVAFHGLQATFYQLVVVTLVLFIGLVHLPALGLLYAAYGAVLCLRGRHFKYLVVGSLAETIVHRAQR